MKVCLLALLMITNVYAWGPEGHRIVGGIADLHLNPATKLQIRKLIGRNSLGSIANWADAIKDHPGNTHTKPWHFVTIPEGQDYHTCTKDPAGDVVEAIDRFTSILANPRKTISQRQQALAFVVHFIGDVHQPLHVGKQGDRGGTALDLRWLGKMTDLHEIWDSKIIFEGPTVKVMITQLGKVSLSRTQDLGNDSVDDWLKEVMDLRPLVYDYPHVTAPGWEREYTQSTSPAVNDQLQKAGIRLAAWLNRHLN